ncbi:SCP2 sterol-binding domain-containing protein [Frigoriglobus tundricola]|uniref:SCP2 sterol-binding domain-containing protein n=1 Tax=Frigoriglobus tundricola TaxID=2774151 RepID=UPI00148ECBD5|nr:SCP2 sterol-binding domain-containing protein [Frigoriglobus tundricola]
MRRLHRALLPGRARGSSLARVPVAATLGFDIRGAGGGRWACRLGGGRVLEVARDSAARCDVEYRMSVPTLAAIVSGRESPQAAFFGRRVEISGNVDQGLELAALFGQFVREFPYAVTRAAEERHDAVGVG